MQDISNIKSLGQQELSGNRNAAASDSQKPSQTVVSQISSPGSDTVSLTSAAEQIQSLQQVLADTPIVDSAKVDALRAAIADGSYTVDSAKVAQNLLNLEGQLN